MSGTSFTDNLGRHYQVVGDFYDGEPRIVLRHMPSGAEGRADSARTINVVDAPAVALAILEAAGIEPDNTGERPEGVALDWLDVWRKAREDKAEREAEDAKVQEWLDARNAEFGATDHWELDDAARAGYRASKAFWEKHLATRDEVPPTAEKLSVPIDLDRLEVEAHEPRVINLGDPEPDRTKEWKDNVGDPWTYRTDGWTWGSSVTYNWVRFQKVWPEVFPLTEVTE